MQAKQTIVAAAFVLAALGGASAPAAIPPHPSELTFPALEFTPPDPGAYRHELPTGVPVYLIPSREFPLITVRFTFKGGRYLEPADQVGLGEALGEMMRRGGTETISAEAMDERFDFLAANVMTRVGGEESSASINGLSTNFDEAFALFMEMVRHPGFDAERLDVYRDEVIEEFKQRNDRPMSVAMLRLKRLLYGEEHYGGSAATQASIDSITPDKLRALHGEIFHPGNLIIAATGDFDEASMLEKLAQAMEGWELRPRVGNPPAPTKVSNPGLYDAPVAQQDLPQGTALLATRTIRRDDPEAIPMEVMNHILGGSGFTSRITNRVRSDEGLAYAAGSFLQPNVYYPGVFAAYTMSKNESVALAIKLILEEIERIGVEPVSEEELADAKSAFIERFPRRFSSKQATLEVFVDDELTQRADGYWQTYRDRVRAVTAEDVLGVAREHLRTDRMLILVVGDWGAIEAGDAAGRASMADFFGGVVTHLPMLDPLTLEPVE